MFIKKIISSDFLSYLWSSNINDIIYTKSSIEEDMT